MDIESSTETEDLGMGLVLSLERSGGRGELKHGVDTES